MSNDVDNTFSPSSATTPSKRSPLDLKTLLASLNGLSPGDGEENNAYIKERLLSKRLSKEMDLGFMADAEIYDDIARSFIRCRMRYDKSSAEEQKLKARMSLSRSQSDVDARDRFSQSRFNMNELDDDSDLSLDGTVTSQTANEEGPVHMQSPNPSSTANKANTDRSYRGSNDDDCVESDSDEERDLEDQNEIKNKMEEMNIDPFKNVDFDGGGTTDVNKSMNNGSKEDIAANLCEEFDLMGGTSDDATTVEFPVGDENSQSTGNVNRVAEKEFIKPTSKSFTPKRHFSGKGGLSGGENINNDTNNTDHDQRSGEANEASDAVGQDKSEKPNEAINETSATPERHNLSQSAMKKSVSSASNKRMLHLSPEMSGRRSSAQNNTPQPDSSNTPSSSFEFHPPPDEAEIDDEDLFFSPEPITSNDTNSPLRYERPNVSEDDDTLGEKVSQENKTSQPTFSKTFAMPSFNIGRASSASKKGKRKKGVAVKGSQSNDSQEPIAHKWNSYSSDVEFLSPDTFTQQRDRYSVKPSTPYVYSTQTDTPDGVAEMDIDYSIENKSSSMSDDQTFDGVGGLFPGTTSNMSVNVGIDLNTAKGFSAGRSPGPRSSPKSRRSLRGKNSAKKAAKSAADYKAGPKPSLSFSSKPSKDSTLYSFSSSFDFQAQSSEDESKKEKMKEYELRSGRVEVKRETARSLYSCKKYAESVMEYTKAIVEHTNHFADFPDPMKDGKNSEVLASLYGNRAAGLMMIGAYNAAACDCQKALGYLSDYNPLTAKSSSKEDLIALLKADGGLTLMTKLLARQGRAYIKMGKVDDAAKTFDYTIRVANSALSCHKNAEERGIDVPAIAQEQSKKVLNQCIIDATLNKSDLKKLKDMSDMLNARGRLDDNIDDPAARRRNEELLPTVNMMLNLCPSDTNIQVAKVICLASMYRWREVASFCEIQACKNAAFGGVFVEDLKELDPFPATSEPTTLSMELFERMGVTILNEKQVGDAVVRMPYGVLRLYLRSLRLEERYIEARAAQNSLNEYTQIDGSLYKQGDFTWFSIEKEKVKRTMSGKDKGDAFYRNGEYLLAAERYASVLKIDSEESLRANLQEDPWEFKTAGGRLHAILHCNRAACFMAMKHFREAAKECTAALRIETKYMKAMLRRARCNARLEHYEESIAEYKRWSSLVEEARMNPGSLGDDVCTFDLATDISVDDYNKAQAELLDVKKMKDVVEQQARSKANEREKFRQTFYQSSRNFARSKSAYSRRQEWYDQEGDARSRRWDTFEGSSPKKPTPKKTSPKRSPKKNKSPKRNSFNQNRRSQSQSRHERSHSASQPSLISPTSNAVTCHYDVLQITKTASEGEIKKAYRKKALQYHPDKNPSSSAAETFRKIKLAYEVLSDERARRLYDVERTRSHYQF